MRKTWYLIIILFVIISCEKDDGIIGYDKIEIEPYILDNYYIDAKYLYLDEIVHDSTNVNYNNPIIDETEITQILKIIQAVYNSNSSERDTVFEVYDIHKLHCYSFNSIYLEVLNESPEITNLINHVFPTGNSQLDDILTTYNFDSVKYYSSSVFPLLILHTNNEYNLVPIEQEFSEIESIQIAGSNKDISCTDTDFGDNISLKRNSNSAVITFGIGRGDCPSGCISQKHWEFKV